MSAASVVIVGVLFALVGLAVWRNIRKGAPCSCGGCGGCAGACGGARGGRALPTEEPHDCAGGDGASHAK